MDYDIIEGRAKSIVVNYGGVIQAEIKISVNENGKQKTLYINKTMCDGAIYTVTKKSIYNIDKVGFVDSLEEYMGEKNYRKSQYAPLFKKLDKMIDTIFVK